MGYHAPLRMYDTIAVFSKETFFERRRRGVVEENQRVCVCSRTQIFAVEPLRTEPKKLKKAWKVRTQYLSGALLFSYVYYHCSASWGFTFLQYFTWWYSTNNLRCYEIYGRACLELILNTNLRKYMYALFMQMYCTNLPGTKIWESKDFIDMSLTRRLWWIFRCATDI